MTWEDDWPVLHPCCTGRKPDIDSENLIQMPTPAEWRSDDFSGPDVKPVWQWNHKPNTAGYSLTERQGWLRLKTIRTARCWHFAPNTLTQPPQDPDSGALVKVDVSQLKEGDWAGLGRFCSYPSFIGVTVEKGRRSVKQVSERPIWGGAEQKIHGQWPLGDQTVVYLKAGIPEFVFGVSYSFSFDGVNFTPIAKPFGIPYNFFSDWLGPRYALFNYATKEAGGIADFDSFTVIPSKRVDNRLKATEGLDVMNADDWSNINRPDNFKATNDGLPHLCLTQRVWGCGGEESGEILGWKNNFHGQWLVWNRVVFTGERYHEFVLRARERDEVAVYFDSMDSQPVQKFKVLNNQELESLFERVPEKMTFAPQGEKKVFLVLTPEPGHELHARELKFCR